jgi:hypothetical protein
MGDVRLTNDVQRAYGWNGSSWVALAVDQNGNLAVPGTFNALGGQFKVGSGWGLQPNFSSGNWAMVTQGNGSLNSAPMDMNGSIHANDLYLRATGKWLSQSVIPPWMCVQYMSYWASGILQDHTFSIYFSNTNQSSGSEGNGWVVVCGAS